MLNGRRALVTGSETGLGLAIATGLAAAGADIALHGLQPPEAMDATLRSISARFGVSATYVQADLASEAGAQSLLDRMAHDGPAPDILVNNAVTRHFGALDSFPSDAWQQALAVNVTAPFVLVRGLVGSMRARGWGRIVNLSSIYAMRATVNRIDYVTTKSAILGFTRAVALETFADGITCNAVCPGSSATPSIEARVKALADEQSLSAEQAQKRFLEGKQPTGRFVGVDDVADLVVFLCRDAARDINGATLPIDGAWLAG